MARTARMTVVVKRIGWWAGLAGAGWAFGSSLFRLWWWSSECFDVVDGFDPGCGFLPFIALELPLAVFAGLAFVWSRERPISGGLLVLVSLGLIVGVRLQSVWLLDTSNLAIESVAHYVAPLTLLFIGACASFAIGYGWRRLAIPAGLLAIGVLVFATILQDDVNVVLLYAGLKADWKIERSVEGKVIVDDSGTVYLLSKADELSLYDHERGEFVHVADARYGYTSILGTDNQGRKWVAGLWYNSLGNTTYEVRSFHQGESSSMPPFPRTGLQAVALDSQGRLFLIFSNAVSISEGQSWRTFGFPGSASDVLRNNAQVDSKGTLWLLSALEGGTLLAFDGRQWKSNVIPFLYSSQVLRSDAGIPNYLIKDRNDRVWTFHIGRGTLISLENGELVSSGHALPPECFPLAFDDQDRVWCRSPLSLWKGPGPAPFKTAGEARLKIPKAAPTLSIVDVKKGEVYNALESGLPGLVIDSLAIDPKGRAWISTSRGHILEGRVLSFDYRASLGEGQ